ncbi:hypothetical protein ES288_D09G054600v1 [Gossypium darwinii]|uniref:HTH CENPB-type domain-containing protein n=2 Tax=Gossypium TaxID=3633 RepID=A0A5D2B756_GOSDA|nr:hypothetical protein ES288_D09G054600v1 [Gossypium darwinii]
MASHLKGVKKSTLTDNMRKTLCEYKIEHPSSSQKDLQQWVQQIFDLSFSKEKKNSNVKRHKSAKYLELEKVLYEWFLQYQEKVNMTGEMIQSKAKEFLQKMYGDANSKFNFSIGWLEMFKARHVIKSYRRFGESGSVVMVNIEYALPQIRAILENFDWKDIYNMDETHLFYRLQADHSLATNILEGNEKGELNPEKINVLDPIHFINAAWNISVKPTTIANYMPLEQEIGDVKGIHKLKAVISDLHYRNAMDVEQILNCPSENESLMESPTNEEIIQGNTPNSSTINHSIITQLHMFPVIQNLNPVNCIVQFKAQIHVIPIKITKQQDPDDSSVLPHISPKEAFLAMDTLKNYLIQHKKNIPDLVYALLKVKDEIIFDSHAKKKQLIIFDSHALLKVKDEKRVV